MQLKSLHHIAIMGDQHSAFMRYGYGLNIAAYVTKPCSDEKLRSAFARIACS